MEVDVQYYADVNATPARDDEATIVPRSRLAETQVFFMQQQQEKKQYEEHMNLARFAEERGSSQFNYGIVVGSSVGAAAALAAVYAMSKCGKASIDDYQRV